ncbi:MAG: hypothetical protein ACTHQQ_21925 [Solirubrobacteraceae bacterium]
MTTRDIRVSTQHTTCDVCGRNLLRGEHAERYVAGGERYWVCDLCVTRAVQDGWVREGTMPAYEPSPDEQDRRRPFLPRLRARLGELLSDGDEEEPDDEDRELDDPVFRAQKRSPSVRTPESIREPRRESRVEIRQEPRHVHAIPTNPEQKVSSAIRAFNGSEHTRTIAGVARSLGAPSVTIQPSQMEASVVRVVAAWELCWYRYEVDLADELPSVRVAAQGAELDELEPTELQSNAAADEDGVLALTTTRGHRDRRPTSGR